MVSNILELIPGLVVHTTKPVQITGGNTPTQVFMTSWSIGNATAYLLGLHISNQGSGAAVINFWDADITSTGVAGTNKPPAIGSNAAPILVPINIAQNVQVYLGMDLMLPREIIGGLTMQSATTGIWVQASYAELISSA